MFGYPAFRARELTVKLLHTFVIGALWATSSLAPQHVYAGERYVVRDARGNRQFVLEQGISGQYSLRDAQGRRIGSGYERMDGSIGLFDSRQRRIGTLSREKR